MSAVKKAAIVAALCGLIVGMLGCRETRAKIEPQAEKFESVELYKDWGTGCEYLRVRMGGVTPRIAADGRSHMGCGGAK